MSVEAIIHQPVVYDEIPEEDQLAFFAGPIQGSPPSWQADGIEMLTAQMEGAPLRIANPKVDTKPEDFDYSAQTRWERKHLIRSFDKGVAIFWLPAQDMSQPYREGRAYGQTTRFEYGMAYLAKWLDPTNVDVVIGMEENYKGSEKYYVDTANELGLPVHSTLEEVCIQAAFHLMWRRSERGQL